MNREEQAHEKASKIRVESETMSTEDILSAIRHDLWDCGRYGLPVCGDIYKCHEWFQYRAFVHLEELRRRLNENFKEGEQANPPLNRDGVDRCPANGDLIRSTDPDDVD